MTAKKDLYERQEPAIAKLFADMFFASDVTDAVPGSMEILLVDGGSDVYVLSQSRGPVRIGHLSSSDVKAATYDVTASYAKELEAAVASRTSRAVQKNVGRKQARADQASALKAEGRSMSGTPVSTPTHPGR